MVMIMNKRGLKTKENIKISFLNLIKDRNPESLTVSELCKESGIHRKTFYSHYHNISDILDELYSDLIKDISDLYSNMLIGAIDDFNVFFDYVNQYIEKNLDYYSLLAKSKQYVFFINRVDSFFTKNIIDRFDNDFNIYQSINKYTLYFLISGITALYTNWMKEPSQCPISYISNTCISMCNKVFGKKNLPF